MFLCKKYFVPLPLSHLPVSAMQATILNREIALKMINYYWCDKNRVSLKIIK